MLLLYNGPHTTRRVVGNPSAQSLSPDIKKAELLLIDAEDLDPAPASAP